MIKNLLKKLDYKLTFKALAIATGLSMLFSMIPFEAECKAIEKDVFRLHIIANSDSEEDQALKIKIRDAVLEKTNSIFEDAQTKEEAINLTKQSLSEIEKIAKQVIKEHGCNYNVIANVTNMYFNTRYYDDITMPSGKYDALRITIGKAEGKNWWCVMYPSLCIGATTNKDALKNNVTESQYDILDSNGEYEYKFKILEIYEWIASFF